MSRVVVLVARAFAVFACSSGAGACGMSTAGTRTSGSGAPATGGAAPLRHRRTGGTTRSETGGATATGKGRAPATGRSTSGLGGGPAFSASYLIGAAISFAESASQGSQDNLLSQLKTHGFNAIRLRTFVDPKDSDGYDPTTELDRDLVPPSTMTGELTARTTTQQSMDGCVQWG